MKASMPVPAASLAVRPTVSSGSAITIDGIILGWKITFLVCVTSLVITEARPLSHPLPAVAGAARVGGAGACADAACAEPDGAGRLPITDQGVRDQVLSM